MLQFITLKNSRNIPPLEIAAVEKKEPRTAKSSLLGNVQIKTERSQTQSRRFRQEPAVIMPENVRQDV